MVDQSPNPLKYILALGVGGSLLGVSNLIWSATEPGAKPIDLPLRFLLLRLCAALILSAAAAVLPFLFLFEFLAEDHLWALIAISLLTATGGAASLDFLMGCMRFIVNLKIRRKP